MENDTLFPIYRIVARWTQDAKPGAPMLKNKSDTAGLLPGRVRNMTSFYRMERSRNDFQIKQKVQKWWQEYRLDGITRPKLTRLSVDFLYYESWCVSWFSHWTFDTGQDDPEALASFHRYVDRVKLYNETHGEWITYRHEGVDTRRWSEAICLMGAEDSWRWKAASEDNPDNPDATPPCRCKHCKKQGVLRIGH